MAKPTKTTNSITLQSGKKLEDPKRVSTNDIFEEGISEKENNVTLKIQ